MEHYALIKQQQQQQHKYVELRSTQHAFYKILHCHMASLLYMFNLVSN